MDLDYTLKTDGPLLSLTKVQLKTNYDKWERPNRICLMVINYTIPITIRGSIPDKVSAKSFLAEVAERFIKLDKVESITHLSKLLNMRYCKFT